MNTKQPSIYIPAKGIESWKALLQDPKKQWAAGYSAASIAEAWHRPGDFPPDVERVFQKAGQPYSGLVPLICIPEHQVPLPGKGKASHNDVWVLARDDGGLVSIAVEGKVKEDFDQKLGDWLADSGVNKRVRLEGLKKLIGLTGDLPNTVRYQLLHRAASAVIEARRFHAKQALLLVHSFSPENLHFEDYAEFTRLYGVEAQVNELVHLTSEGGIHLDSVWINSAVREAK